MDEERRAERARISRSVHDAYKSVEYELAAMRDMLEETGSIDIVMAINARAVLEACKEMFELAMELPLDLLEPDKIDMTAPDFDEAKFRGAVQAVIIRMRELLLTVLWAHVSGLTMANYQTDQSN